MRRVRITIGPVELFARLFDTPAGQAIGAALPFASLASVAGGTVRFATPASIPATPASGGARRPGDLAISRERGMADIDFANLAFRRRPRDDGPRPGNIWARAMGDIAALQHVADGDTVIVEGIDYPLPFTGNKTLN